MGILPVPNYNLDRESLETKEYIPSANSLNAVTPFPLEDYV